MEETQDKEIKCTDCADMFTFTKGEQAFYAERQMFTPKRCKPCRDIKRREKERAEAAR